MNKYTSRVKKGVITSPNLNTEEGRGLKRVCLFLLLWIIQKYNLLSTDSLFCEFFFIYFFFVLAPITLLRLLSLFI